MRRLLLLSVFLFTPCQGTLFPPRPAPIKAVPVAPAQQWAGWARVR